MGNIKTIGFDADDTLWHNEHYFAHAHTAFRELMAEYMDHDELAKLLLKREIANIKTLGYGIKSFTLSMMETALDASRQKLSAQQMQKVLDIGREMTSHPVDLLEGVGDVLDRFKGHYDLVLITKGDLVDQERKVVESGLAEYFHGIEIVSEKSIQTYHNIFAKHGGVDSAVMVGNSVKSDVLPAVAAGAWGIHVPYHTTWELEFAEPDRDHERYLEADNITHAAQIIRDL